MIFFFRYLVLLFTIILIQACASIGSPGGGKIDNAPPKLVSVFPEDKTYIEENQSIKLSFNERINSLNLSSHVRIEPHVDIYIKVSNNEITINPVHDWPDIFKIFVSRKLSDYHGNSITAPIEIFFSQHDSIDNKKVKGQLYNIDDSKIYEVAIINEDYLIISKTESDIYGNVIFSGINSLESLFILAIENKITDNFIDDIRNYKYGLSNQELNYNSNSVYISDPIYKAKINNINLYNSYFGKINLSNGYKIPFILNNSQFSEHIYESSEYIFLESNLNDSLFLDLKYRNSIEEYNIKSSFHIYKALEDTISPLIVESFISNDSLLFRFDEPISIDKEIQVFSYVQQDSLISAIDYKYLSPELIFLDKIDFKEINIDCRGIKDLYNNNLCDSLLIVSQDNIEEKSLQSTLGIVEGNIIYNGINSLIVEVINLSNNETKRTFVEDKQFIFNDLLPGEYKIWVYEDINNVSNSYFSGTLEPQIKKAARFGIFSNQLTIRGNWSNTITINLE